MITYELAEQLKEVGFPQRIAGDGYFIDDQEKNYDWGEELTYRKDLCYIPTLSELIEACGEKFYSLHRGKKKWHAGEFIEKKDKLRYPREEGDTPEEAVAKLWLKLKKREPPEMGYRLSRDG